MTYQPPQNILAAILQSRKQNAYNDPGVPMPNVSAPQLPSPAMQQGGNGGVLGSSFGQMLGLAPQQQGAQPQASGGALGMISQMLQPSQSGQPQQQNNIMSLISNLFGGQK